jgi:hypothetical protein
MDEAMAHSLWQRGIAAVTAKLSLRYPPGGRIDLARFQWAGLD